MPFYCGYEIVSILSFPYNARVDTKLFQSLVFHIALEWIRNFFNLRRICTDIDFRQLTEIYAISATGWNVGAVVSDFRNLYTTLSDEIPYYIELHMFHSNGVIHISSEW